MKQQNPLYRAVGMLGALVAAIGCSGVDDNNDAGSSADALIAARGRQHRRVNPAPGNAGGSASSGAAGAASSSSAGTAANAAAASDDLGALIAAAQTPDGRAIPQAAGPNGECPPVFVALGFWSCPQLAQTCAFPGRAQPCRCAPSSGEGQFSAWVCD